MTRTRGGFRSLYAVLFFLWFIFVSSQLVYLFALHQETIRSPPRKTRVFFKVDLSSLRAPSATLGSQTVNTREKSYHNNDNNNNNNNITNNNSRGQDVVYEDDKRIIHTGPNPLHN